MSAIPAWQFSCLINNRPFYLAIYMQHAVYIFGGKSGWRPEAGKYGEQVSAVAKGSPPLKAQGVCLTQISWSVAKPSDFALAISASTFALGGLGERERIQR